MATNTIRPDTKNVNVNMPIELRKKLDDLSARSGMKLSAYVRKLFDKAAQNETVYRVQEVPTREAKSAKH